MIREKKNVCLVFLALVLYISECAKVEFLSYKSPILHKVIDPRFIAHKALHLLPLNVHFKMRSSEFESIIMALTCT